MDVYDYVLQNCKEMDLKNLGCNRFYDNVFYSIVKTKQVVKLGSCIFISTEKNIKHKNFCRNSIFSLEERHQLYTPRHIVFNEQDNHNIYFDTKDNKIKCNERTIDFPVDKDEYFNYNLICNLPPYDELMKIKSVLDYITNQNSQIELQIYKANFNGCL